MSYTITPENHLIRRVPNQPSHVDRDTLGQPQLSSAVFKHMPATEQDGVSVDLLEIWLTLGTWEEALHEAAFKHFTKLGATYLAAILPAAVPLREGLACVHDPILATELLPANPTHALILGRIDKPLARKLAKACKLLEGPPAPADS